MTINKPRLQAGALLLLSPLLLTACGSDKKTTTPIPVESTAESLSSTGNLDLVNGQSSQLNFVISYSDNSTKAIDASELNFADCSTDSVSIDNSGTLSAASSASSITATCPVTWNELLLTLEVSVRDSDATASAIRISPSGPLNLTLNAKQQLSLVGSYSDGSTIIPNDATWSCDNGLDINNNELSTSALGSADCTVTWQQQNATITVNTKGDSQDTLTAISFDNSISSCLNVGVTRQLSVSGNYSISGNKDISTLVSWSCDGGIVSIVDGELSANMTGMDFCTASLDNIEQSTKICIANGGDEYTVLEISGASSAPLAVGSTLGLSAEATDPQLTPKDVSKLGAWSCTDSAIASIDSNGILSANAIGNTDCKLEWQGLKDEFSVSIIECLPGCEPLPAGISLVPNANFSMNVAQQALLQARGNYDHNVADETDPQAFTWSCSNSAVASVDQQGIVTAKAEGSSDCSASWNGHKEAITITVEKSGPEVDGFTLFLLKPSDWAECRVYLFKDSTALGAQFPGETMTAIDGDWCQYKIADTISQTDLVFSDGTDSDAKKSDDITAVTESGCYDGSWKTLDQCEFANSAANPSASAQPAGGTFLSNELKVTLNTSNSSTAFYALEANKACSQGTAFSSGDKISIGQQLALDESTTLYLCAKQGAIFTTQEYVYSKKELIETGYRLGATWSASETHFSIWSPDSSNVKLFLDGEGELDMQARSDGDGYSDVYEITVSGDQHLKEYNFIINGQGTMDPYAKMVKPGGNAIVMNMSTSEPSGGWAPIADNGYYQEREDAIIYEMSVRDFTKNSNSGVSGNNGKFIAMTEAGTKNGSDATGIDHIVDLGVTHIQIMPMYDFDSCSDGGCYSWGYDPSNYNVPEESYGSAGHTDYVGRASEVKNMINEFHKRGIRVIIDVVYNHNSGTFAGRMGNITNKYFNGGNMSGTGNALESHVPMVSRMIQDSLEYWVSEYHVDGFRFDLIGIFDYEAVGVWAQNLENKFSSQNLQFYGEPWDGTFGCSDYVDWWTTVHPSGKPACDAEGLANGFTTHPLFDNRPKNRLREGNLGNLVDQHVGVFNDQLRNGIKGDSNNDGKGKGYIFDDLSNYDDGLGILGVVNGLAGSLQDTNSHDATLPDFISTFALDPEQTINYVSAHDNLGLWDKLIAWKNDTGASDEHIRNLDKFAMSIVLTSQGVPFIHGGDEMLRDKQGEHNSYDKPDSVNQINWDWLSQNRDAVEFYKALIQLRRDHKALRMNTWQQIKDNVSITQASDNEKVIFNAINGAAVFDTWDDILIIYNPSDDYSATLPAGNWSIALQNNEANSTGSASGTVLVKGSSMMVLHK